MDVLYVVNLDSQLKVSYAQGEISVSIFLLLCIIIKMIIFVIDVRVFNNSYYGKSKRPVNINNVACTGMESQLLECNYFEFSLSDKKSLRSLIDVVGVMCGGADSSSDTETASEGTTSCINPQWTALLSGVFATLILLITVSVTLIPIQM